MAVYKCDVCDYLYDEDKEGIKWSDLPADWVCPVCGSPKSYFKIVEGDKSEQPTVAPAIKPSTASADDFRRTSDELEIQMADIHAMAETGRSVIEPMRTKKPVISWDDILIKGAQLARIPLNE